MLIIALEFLKSSSMAILQTFLISRCSRPGERSSLGGSGQVEKGEAGLTGRMHHNASTNNGVRIREKGISGVAEPHII